MAWSLLIPTSTTIGTRARSTIRVVGIDRGVLGQRTILHDEGSPPRVVNQVFEELLASRSTGA